MSHTKLKILVNHVGNPQKAARFSVFDENGATLMDEVPVSLPADYYVALERFGASVANEGLVDKLRLIRAQTISADMPSPEDDPFNTLRAELRTALPQKIDGRPGRRFLVSASSSSAVVLHYDPSAGAPIPTHDRALVVDISNFTKLHDLLKPTPSSNLNLTSIPVVEPVVKKSLFFFSSTPVTTTSKGLSAYDLESYTSTKMDVDSVVRRADDNRKRRKAEEAKRKADRLAAQRTEKHADDLAFRSAKRTLGNLPPSKFSSPSNTGTQFNSTHSSNDDGMDLMLAVMAPDIAPFLRPNSALAWFAYFNHNHSNHTAQSFNSGTENIPGFENATITNVQNTRTGYSALIQAPGQSDCEVHYNADLKQMEFIDKGSQCVTSLTAPSGNGKIYLTLDTPSGDSLKSELLNTPKGTIGNWTAEQSNGNTVTSHVKFSPNFDSSSSGNDASSLYNLGSGEMSQGSTSTSKMSSSTFSQTTEDVYVPPPPPPRFGSDDPYSSSSSMSP